MKWMKRVPGFWGSLFFVVSFSATAFGANYFVRAGATGTNTGADWNNAWNGFTAINWANVSCGDTIWVAGGTYQQDLRPAKKCTSSSRLSIRRARSDAAEVTAAAGWNSSYDSVVHQTGGGGIGFNGDWDFITISGRSNASGGAYGWWIDLRGQTGGTGIEFANGAIADSNIIEYMDIQGPGNITYSIDGRGIDATPFSGASGNVFSHLRIFDWESAIYHAGMNNTLMEYLDIYDITAVNWQDYHPNGIYTVDSNNVTVRYSKFHKGPKGNGVGEGIFFEQGGGASNWTIYGNLFYNLDSTGLKAIHVTSTVPGLKIFNNTFVNQNYGGVLINGGSCGADSEARNNLTFNAPAMDICGTNSNNLNLSTSPDPFVNAAAFDFHIKSTVGTGYPRNAGMNLSSYFTDDADRQKFGGDGVWDIGAFEYSSGNVVPPLTLAAPKNLRFAN